MALFLGAFEILLDRGQRLDWFSSPVIQWATVISVVSLIAFIPWELSRKDPVVNIRMLGQRNFAVACVLIMVVGVLIFGTTQFIPELLQQVLGYTATNAGLALSAGGAVTILMMPLAGVLSSKIDPRYLIAFSFICQTLALWNMSHLNTGIAFRDAALARAYQSVALPFLFVPVTAIAYVGLKPEQNNQASALLNTLRNMGGSIGISMVQTLTAQREQFHQARYVETLNPLNPNYVNALNQTAAQLQANGQPAAAANQQALQRLYGQLNQQAAMLSYADAFHLLMFVTAGCLPLLMLMRPPKPGAQAHGPE